MPKTMLAHNEGWLDFSILPARDEGGTVCAIHARLGGNQDILGADSNEAATFFRPQVAFEGGSLGCCRSWSIVARVANFQGGDDNSVHLFSLPLGWKADVSLDEDRNGDEKHCCVPYYLSCRLVLPSPYRVKEIAFYGDDGNSSLSAGTDGDGGTGQEGRQAMGLLVSCPVKDDSTHLTAEELWLVQYDHAIYNRVSLPSGDGCGSSVCLDDQFLTDESVVSVQPLQERQNEDSIDDQGVIYAKSTCRFLGCSFSCVRDTAQPTHLFLFS